MSSVSLCMIVKNEEKILRKSLDSIKDVADEIIITDTGSTDSTIDIIKEYTNKVYFYKWDDSFSNARNYCSQFATCDYILRWDADFVLRDKEKNIKKILELKKRNFENKNVIFFSWNIEFGEDNKPIKSLSNYFFYTRKDFHWESPVHNFLTQNDLNAKLTSKAYFDIEVDHYKDVIGKKERYIQTAKILTDTLKKNPNDLRLLFNYGEGLIFDKKFDEAIRIYLQFLDSNDNKDLEKIPLAIECLLLCYLSLQKYDDAKILVNKYFKDFSNDSRFILAYADATAIHDLFGSKEYYLKYLSKPVIKENTRYIYDFERYYIHPILMLSHIYIEEKNFTKAKKTLKIIINETSLHETRNFAILLMDKLKFDEIS